MMINVGKRKSTPEKITKSAQILFLLYEILLYIYACKKNPNLNKTFIVI